MCMYLIYIQEFIIFLQNGGILGLVMSLLHVKEQHNMEVLIYEI